MSLTDKNKNAAKEKRKSAEVVVFNADNLRQIDSDLDKKE